MRRIGPGVPGGVHRAEIAHVAQPDMHAEEGARAGTGGGQGGVEACQHLGRLRLGIARGIGCGQSRKKDEVAMDDGQAASGAVGALHRQTFDHRSFSARQSARVGDGTTHRRHAHPEAWWRASSVASNLTEVTVPLLLADVRPLGAAATDVLLRDGRIAAVGKGVAADGALRIEGRGRLLLPGLIEGHTHLDKTLLGLPWQPHGAGPEVRDKIANERALRRQLHYHPGEQAERQLARLVAAGTAHVRTHVDVDTEIGLAHVDALLAVRDAWRDRIDVEIVAFPQSGMLIRPGTLELLDRALALGCDLLGGLDPSAIDRDPKGHLDALFALAERHGKGLDIHLHEPNELGAFALDLIFERIAATGMAGKVAVSHAFCLALPAEAGRDRLVEGLVRHDVAIVTTAPAGRPAPDMRLLARAGVRVAGGSDGCRDAWTPYGTTDMLERAALIGQRWNYRRDEDIAFALELMSGAAAAVLGLEDYGLDVGAVADLVLVDAETVAEAVVARPRRDLVVKRGRVVAGAERGNMATVGGVAP